VSGKKVGVYSDRIINIEPLGQDSYRVRIQVLDGKIIESVCQLCWTTLKSGRVIRTVSIDSEEYGIEVMKGNINSRSICKQVSDYHDQLSASGS
jgi:hypothetical protein